MTVKQLHRRWAITTVLAIIAFAILAYFEARLTAASGQNIRALQFVNTADGFSTIFGAWIARPNAAMAGFSLGFDYLFMPLYAFAFYYSGLIVRERFTPKPGTPRRLMQLVAAIPLAGALADAVENGLEAHMLFSGPTDHLANIAYTATNAKMICFYIGLVLLLGAIVARMLRRKTEEDA